MSALLTPLVTVAAARRPYRPIERHVFTATYAGATSLCHEVQYTATLTDGLRPWCDLCRAGALAAIAVTGSLLSIGGLAGLRLDAAPEDLTATPGELAELWGK